MDFPERSAEIIKRVYGYNTTRSLGDSPNCSTDNRMYTPCDILFHRFEYNKNDSSSATPISLWAIACGRAGNGGVGTNGEDILIAEAVTTTTTYVPYESSGGYETTLAHYNDKYEYETVYENSGKYYELITRPYMDPAYTSTDCHFYRYHVDVHTNQKMGKIMIAKVTNLVNFTISGYEGKYYGTEIFTFCAFDSDILPWWMPGFLPPRAYQYLELQQVSSEKLYNAQFPLVQFHNEYSGVSLDQWLSCKALTHFNVLTPGGQSHRFLAKFNNITDNYHNSGINPGDQVLYLYALNLPVSNVDHFLDVTISGNDVWIAGNGGMIQCTDLYTYSYTSGDETYDSTKTKEYQVKHNGASVQFTSSTYNEAEQVVYAVGTYDSAGSSRGAAISFDISGGSVSPTPTDVIPTSPDRIVTTCQIDKTVTGERSINNLYTSIQSILTTIKTNKNNTNNIPNSNPATTWKDAYEELLNSPDADIVDFLTGRRLSIL